VVDLFAPKAPAPYPLQTADSAGERRRGFLGHERAPDHGLLLHRCPLVHMLGMSFALDIAFCDRGGVIRALYEDVRPGFRLRGSLRAWSCVELPAGVAGELGLERGQLLRMIPTD
jgi:uncharacterized membrane protein (UPF0127 family)